jgi:hypothetical protein
MLDVLSPRSLDASEGDAFWFLNNLEIVKATTASTGGAFSLTISSRHPVTPRLTIFTTRKTKPST